MKLTAGQKQCNLLYPMSCNPLRLCDAIQKMAHGRATYFRSKSLNAQWEDLSRSVGDVLLVHEGPPVNAEGRSQITTAHWVSALERTHCVEGSCRKR